jgi:hypothetical protein
VHAGVFETEDPSRTLIALPRVGVPPSPALLAPSGTVGARLSARPHTFVTRHNGPEHFLLGGLLWRVAHTPLTTLTWLNERIRRDDSEPDR